MLRLIAILFLIFFFNPAIPQFHDAELLDQETTIIIKNGTLIKKEAYEIRINNRNGEKFTKITIPYSDLNQVSKIKALLKNNRGEIVKKIRKNDISERSAISDISFYEDNYIKEFNLKHNNYPYILNYSFESRQKDFLIIDHWIPVLDYNVPTLNASLNLHIPRSYKISYEDHFIERFKKDSVESGYIYSWETTYNGLITPEIYSSPPENFLPGVRIVPVNFKYDINGTLESWISFGNWQNELLDDLSDLDQNEKNRILSIVKDEENKREKIKKLYHTLQDETRYINVSIETGGLKPYPASYVAHNKYGDCKALSNYFKSVLEVININSYYAKIYAGEKIKKINKDLPSQQFNHVILYVPGKRDTLWLDCTSEGPFNHLGVFTQNREAFIVDNNHSTFTRTPALSKNDVCNTKKVIIRPGINLVAMAEFNNSYKGKDFEILLYIYRSLNLSEKKQAIQNNYIENGFTATHFDLIHPNRDSSHLYLTYRGESNRIYNQYGNEIIIKLLITALPDFETPEKRKLPVQFDYPFYTVDSLEYEIPNGFKVTSLPEDQIIKNPYGEYRISYEKIENMVNVIKSIHLKPGLISLSEYDKFYQFMDQIRSIENGSYIVTSKF